MKMGGKICKQQRKKRKGDAIKFLKKTKTKKYV